jgi:hypothetical protein
MSTQLPPILTKSNQLGFIIGNRAYFVMYHFNGTMENMFITYGACVLNLSQGGFLTGNDDVDALYLDGHFDTATERYTRFPAKALFNYPSSNGVENVWFPAHLTRHAMTKVFSSKKFQKRLVNLFCMYGVRFRPNGISSLRGAEYQQKIRMIRRLLGKAINQKQTDMGKFNRNHPPNSQRVHDDFTEDDLAKLEQSTPNFAILEERKRTIHIVYQHLPNGKTIYGACFFRPEEEAVQNYCQYDHLETAYKRMADYGVRTTLPSSMRYTTRSNGISEHDSLAWKSLRKAIGKYGVRSRGEGDNRTNFLTKHLIQTKFSSDTKQLNREMGKVSKTFSDWRKLGMGPVYPV